MRSTWLAGSRRASSVRSLSTNAIHPLTMASPQEFSLLSEHSLPSSPPLQEGMFKGPLLPLTRATSYSPRQTTRLALVLITFVTILAWVGLKHSDSISVDKLNLESLSLWRNSNQAVACDAPTILPPEPQRMILPDDISTWPSPTADLPLDATLEERIAAWNETPISTAVHWVRFNAQTCPPSITDVNKLWGFIAPIEIPNGPWAKWWKNPIEVAKLRQEIFNYLLDVNDAGLLGSQHYGHGKGIVFSAGNLDTFYRVVVTLRLLRRHLNTTMPAEIFSFPGENPPAELLPELEELNAKHRVLTSLSKDPARTKNWHIKATALIESSFQQILYLDSDNMPAVPLDGPDSVFESPGFKRLGVMFWPDYWKTVAHNPVWQIIGVQCRDEWEQEAGQILIDKSKHLDVLRLTEYMLLRYKTWFALSDGDKDLFRFAMLALRKRWAIPGAFVGSASWGPERPAGYCSHTMLQNDHTGRPAFVHGNMLKKLPWTLPFSNTSKATGIWGMTKRANITTNEDLDCDHFANVDRFGEGIKPAPSDRGRRRAALEKGIRSWFRATPEYTSCLDQRWDDPRNEDVKLVMKYIDMMGPAGNHEIAWTNPMVEEMWENVPHLATFERKFWDVGGKAAGIGFG